MANRKTPQSKKSSASDKPNILVIMGDDIGLWNVSAYSQGMMGYQTPNIDRIANEGGESTSGERGGAPRPVRLRHRASESQGPRGSGRPRGGRPPFMPGS